MTATKKEAAAKSSRQQATTPRADSTPDDSTLAERRRQHIREVLENDRAARLTFHDVMKEFGKVSDTVLYKDAERLRKQGCPIDTVNKHFVYNEERLRLVGQRIHQRAREKASIGRIATQLIMPLEDEQKRFPVKDALRLRLGDYWRKGHRLLILDSGSTTAAIAHRIAAIKTPDGKRHLSHLRVLTNGDLVHHELNTAECKHGLIFLGGAERFDTGAIAGTLAERCLDAWGLQADIAIIGTTNLNPDGKWCCDHEDEAYIKSRLLASARIRCLAADSQKLVNPGSGSSFPFADFSAFTIDLIITDPLIHRRHKGEQEDRRRSFLDWAAERGLFVATEPEHEYDRSAES